MPNQHDWSRYYNGPEDNTEVDSGAGYGFYDLEDEEIEMMERQRISEIKAKPTADEFLDDKKAKVKQRMNFT